MYSIANPWIFDLFVYLKNDIATILLFFYFVLNVFYCFKLKQLSIVDITIVAIGFVIRLFIGSTVTSIVLSHWIIILTFLIALSLVVGKRRNDVVIFTETGQEMRKVLPGIILSFLIQ